MAGVILPLVPTVPFMLLAAFCFGRSSQKLHDWLLAHPVFGPAIVDWRQSGAISRRGKRIATASICVLPLLTWVLDFPTPVLVVQCLALVAVLAFILTRPTAHH